MASDRRLDEPESTGEMLARRDEEGRGFPVPSFSEAPPPPRRTFTPLPDLPVHPDCPTISRAEVWLRAWLASTTLGRESKHNTANADACLKAYDERFPTLKGPM